MIPFQFLRETSPRRTASASSQHSLPTAISFIQSVNFSLPLVTIEKETFLLSDALDPKLSPTGSHFDLLITEHVLISSYSSHLFPSYYDHQDVFKALQSETLSLPLWLQAPCSSPSVSLKHIREQTLGFLICSSISIHFTPRCNGGSTCYFTETVLRSPMTSLPKTMCILSAYYCGWPVEETRLPWFLNFKNSSALLSCELALAVAELTYTVLVTNRWSRWCYCSWNYLIHPKIHPCLFPLK